MDTYLTDLQEVFTEFNFIKNNIVWFKVYNTTVTVQLCTLYRNKYYLTGKPKVYTFGTINLLNHFVKMLDSCKLQKVN